MPEGDLGTAACYLMVERLALQAGVESPFWDEASLLMGGCEEPWYKKPLTPCRLRLFLKRYGGSLLDDGEQYGQAAFVFSDVMRLHGIPLGGGADGLGALYVRRAESVAMTVAFLATGCTLADMAAITGLGEEAVVERITRTWDGDAPGRIYGLAHAAHHDRIPETFASSDDLDEAEEFPMSLLDRLPYDCVFIQHRETIEFPFVFRGHELSGTVEREGYFCFRDAEGFHIAALNGQVDFMMGMDNTIAPIPITLEDYKSIGDCKDAAAIGTLAIAEEAKIEMAVETGIVAKDDSLEMASRLQMEAAGVSDMEKILGTLMYISSKEADVRTVYVPQKNQTRKSRQTDCTVHDVGFRVAPQLGEVRRVYEHEAKGQDGGKTGRHVAPHVRRGHWHGYWTGPRENPTGLEIKWVAPTIVNGSRGELEGTVHEVGDRDGRYTLKSTQRECGRAAEQLNGAGRSEEQARDGKSDR